MAQAEQTGTRKHLPELLPRPALLQVLRYLRASELNALGQAYPSIDKSCHDEFNEIDRELVWRTSFKWSRAYDLNASELMASRQNHCTVYFEPQHAIYLFGGETTNIYSARNINGHGHNLTPISRSNASFNDLWKLDLVTMHWSRVVVPAPPYPLPKSMATMVVWKVFSVFFFYLNSLFLFQNEIVLYGGFRPLPEQSVHRTYQTPPSLCEVHIFNPAVKQWRQLNTNTDGPCLAGHTATISGNLMIVYGGWDVYGSPFITRDLHILDLVAERWYTKRLAGGLSTTTARRDVLNDPNRFYPELHPIRSHLITLREGELLLIGEMMPHDYGSALLIKFDPNNPQNCDWQWKAIEVTGRWNRPKLLDDGATNFACSLPNFNYPQLAAVRTGKLLRLVSLGLPIDKSSTKTYISVYDKCQLRGKKFVDLVALRLAEEMDRREAAYRHCADDEDVSPASETVELDGLTCKMENCYLTREKILECKK
ncbi:hypothetical protein WR25_19624 isoform D [Diploscapter pachys]|uniref:F-box domain-containing protein n=3 Tax=Diploscapter pachys TaxID=2018661 RepID=A0A2A2JTB7_9BILA|nr:hypothetical protein WR25_19624 isoform D [Diploscapter pachys]